VVNRRLIEKADSLLKKEHGTIFKNPGGKINICLVWPNTYHIGMSNLGFLGLYSLLNSKEDVLCERAFLPDQEDIGEFQRTGTEIFSLESKRPIGRFDIVAFSTSFENDYPNVVKILELSNIPLLSEKRQPHHPLLIAGGVCAFSNPEPMAEFFDILFIGEAEEMIDEFLREFRNASDRDDLLKRALGVEGLYVPKFYNVSYNPSGTIRERHCTFGAPEVIKRRYIKDLSGVSFGPLITTPETEFSDMYLIEAMRGCPWNCSFCLAGHIYNPPRAKTLEALRAEIGRAGGRRIGLIAPSLTEYPYISEILKEKGVEFSITSLRASPRSASILDLIEGKRSISIAPEAGTERLRMVINKKISERDIIQTSEAILRSGIKRLRLYFMIGLPTEKEEDIDGIISLVNNIRSTSAKGEITLTLSTFVPKPFTPFQWHKMEKIEIVVSRLKKIKKSLTSLSGVRVFHDVPKFAYMQGIFSLGDRRVSKIIAEVARGIDWQRAAKECNIEPDFYIHRCKDISEPLAWDFIESGIKKESLWIEYQRALSIA